MCNQFLQQIIAINEDFIFTDKYADITDKYLSKEKTLELLLSTRLIKHISGDRYVMDNFGRSVMMKTKGVLYGLPKPYNENDINSAGFRKKLIFYLRRQPKKRGDISSLINDTIDRSDKRKRQVQDEIADLEKIKTIEFYDNGSYLLGHNVNRGDEAEDIFAGLTSEYRAKSWWDRQPTGSRILIGIGMPLIVASIIWIVKIGIQHYTKIENSISTEQHPTDTQSEKNVDATTNDALLYKKNILMDTLTQRKQ